MDDVALARDRTLTKILFTVFVAAVAIATTRTVRDPRVQYLMVDEVVARGIESFGARPLRIHGWVMPGSIGGVHAFRLHKNGQQIAVDYDGVYPDTFRDQSELVVTGRFRGGVFVAEALNGKCATKYEAVEKPQFE